MIKPSYFYVNTARNMLKDGLFSPYNILRISGILSRKKVFTGPLKVVVDVTNVCDMGCLMCWHHSSLRQEPEEDKKNLSAKDFLGLVKELKALRTRTIMLCGSGEPFLNPEIFDMIRMAREEGLNVEIMTNAYHLDKEKIKLLLKMNVDKILVSIHASDTEEFKRIHPLKEDEDFKKITDNLSLLKSGKIGKRPRLYIINVISALNYKGITGMSSLAKYLKADKVIFKPLHHPFKNKSMEIETTGEIEECRRALRIVASELELPNNASSYLKIPVKSEMPAAQPKLPCYVPWIQSVIDIHGNILGCAHAKHIILGNIYKEGFYRVWNSDPYTEFRSGRYCRAQCHGKILYPLLNH